LRFGYPIRTSSFSNQRMGRACPSVCVWVSLLFLGAGSAARPLVRPPPVSVLSAPVSRSSCRTRSTPFLLAPFWLLKKKRNERKEGKVKKKKKKRSVCVCVCVFLFYIPLGTQSHTHNSADLCVCSCLRNVSFIRQHTTTAVRAVCAQAWSVWWASHQHILYLQLLHIYFDGDRWEESARLSFWLILHFCFGIRQKIYLSTLSSSCVCVYVCVFLSGHTREKGKVSEWPKCLCEFFIS
jgi:hypothetical protein